jgi:ParB-like chromosome segregation protein Spo0J
MTDQPKFHPACLLLPELSEQEYRGLVEDIREHGQRRAITLDEDGVVLDGRHRDRACRELGIEPETEVFRGTEAEKIALVMSENIHRRHLTTEQRAAIAAELSEKLAAAARDRMLAGTPAPTDARGKATEQAARMIGSVSPRSVERAKHRMRTDPAARAKAKAGNLPRKPRRSKVQGCPGVEGVDYRLVEDRRGYNWRERIEEPATPPPPDIKTELGRIVDRLQELADRAAGTIPNGSVAVIARELRELVARHFEQRP